MLIADAQVHIWAPSTAERPWPPITKKPHRDQPMGADELLREMDAAGVDRAILVNPSWEGVRNDLVLAAAQSHPDRFRVMGRIDHDSPDAPGDLARLASHPHVAGLRMAFHTPQLQRQLAEGELEWVWQAAQEARLPIMIYAPHASLAAIETLAAAHPGLRLIMCHLSIPIGTQGDAAFDGLDRLLALARYPNVAAKASGLPGHSAQPYPHVDVHQPLRRTLDAFGKERVFWGTDLSRLRCTYLEAVQMFTEHMPWLDAAELEWIMGRGLCEWIGWKLDPGPSP